MAEPPYRECVIYIRTSTADQNPTNQLEACESIQPKGQTMDTFTNYTLLEDKQSAWKDHQERVAFDSLRNAIKHGKVKHLIVWDLDRIYRNRKKLIQFFEFCKIYNCKIYSYRQRWLEELNNIPEPFNDIMHSLMLNLMGWLAEDESNKKSERVKSAVRKKNGKTVSYKGNKWGRKQTSTQKKNKVIKMYLEEMKTYRQISTELKVSLGAVHKILTENNIEKRLVVPFQKRTN